MGGGVIGGRAGGCHGEGGGGCSLLFLFCLPAAFSWWYRLVAKTRVGKAFTFLGECRRNGWPAFLGVSSLGGKKGIPKNPALQHQTRMGSESETG